MATKNNVQSAVLALCLIALRGKERFLFCKSLIRYQPETQFFRLFPIGPLRNKQHFDLDKSRQKY
jgi:hypothetical protein